MMRKYALMTMAAICSLLFMVPRHACGQEPQAEQDPQAEQEQIPGEYKWIFGELDMPSVGDDGELIKDDAPAASSKGTIVRREDFVGKSAEKPVAAPREPYTQGASLDSNTWHFGEVEAGMVLEHEFIVENKSNRTINITSVNTSCGCTVSQVDKKTLEVGEKAPIAVRLKTKGYSGEIKQSVFVHTDDPRQPVIRYMVRAKIIRAGG